MRLINHSTGAFVRDVTNAELRDLARGLPADTLTRGKFVDPVSGCIVRVALDFTEAQGIADVGGGDAVEDCDLLYDAAD